jgi:hypothetical protein
MTLSDKSASYGDENISRTSPSPELEDITENLLRPTPLISHQQLKNMGILEADYTVIENGEKKTSRHN